MIIYKYGALHLYPECRGVRGTREVVEDALLDKLCRICVKKQARILRAQKLQALRDTGISLANIGRKYGISRQAVSQLLRR